MRVGTRIDEMGVLLADNGSFSLRRDAGGRYALDMRRTPVDEIGQRVRIIGTYVGNDLIDVDEIQIF